MALSAPSVTLFDKILSFARADHVAHCARSLSYLLSDSHAQHQSLAKGTVPVRFISDEDFCFGYATETSYLADEPGRAHGYEIEELDGAAYVARDPLYRGQFAKVVCYKNSDRISDQGPIWPRFWLIFKRKAARC